MTISSRRTAAALEEEIGSDDEVEALARSTVSQFESYVKLNKKISPEVLGTIGQIEDYSKLADTIASHLAIKISDKQEILEVTSISDRLERVFGLMESEISVLQVEKKIRSRVKRQMEKTQREYYLNEQMKAIQKELGDGDERDDIQEFEDKIENTKLSKEARDKALAELKKLKQMSPMSAEATVVRNYLDWILSIPWGTRTARSRRTWVKPRPCSMRSTTALRRSRNGSSNISPCRTGRTSSRGRSCASLARPVSVKHHLASRSPTRPVASSCACRLAACATKPRSAVTGAPTSARCPAR